MASADCERPAQLVGAVCEEGALGVHHALHAVDHRVEGGCELAHLARAAGERQAAGEVCRTLNLLRQSGHAANGRGRAPGDNVSRRCGQKDNSESTRPENVPQLIHGPVRDRKRFPYLDDRGRQTEAHDRLREYARPLAAEEDSDEA
jgi:hypothetical protein